MRTKELIKKTKELGYCIEYDNYTLSIYSRDVRSLPYLLSVDTEKQYSLRIFPKNFSSYINQEEREELYNLVVEYDKTPVDKREEKRKYYIRLKGANIEVMRCYLNKRPNGNFYFDDHVEQNDIQTKFTYEEILDLPIWVKDMLDDGYLIKEEAEDDF